MSIVAAVALVAAPRPGSCRAAYHDYITREDPPGRVEGASLAGPQALVRARRERGNALIFVFGGSFRGADLRGARLHNICFVATDFSGSDWRGARAEGSGFIWGELAGANLSGADMRGVLLDRVLLERANAAGADWSGGRFEGNWRASLTGLNLERANLRGFQLRCGITDGDECISRTPLRADGADLTGASLLGWRQGLQVRGARLDRTQVEFHQLRDLAAGRFAGPLILRGGAARVEIAREDAAAIVAAEVPEPTDTEWVPPARPSFACAATRTAVERMICAEPNVHLRSLDLAMAPVYRRALRLSPALRAGQRAWLAARDRCTDRPCVERAYLLRTEYLEAQLGRPSWLRPGAHALFVAEPLRFAESFRGTRLYHRILPAIIGGTKSRVFARVNADGSVQADGDAIGGEAHMCGLERARLAYDPATGWFSAPYRYNDETPPDHSAPPMRVLRFQGEAAEVFREGRFGSDDDPVERRPSNFVLCGAHAHFPAMVRVPVSRAAFERFRRAQLY